LTPGCNAFQVTKSPTTKTLSNLGWYANVVCGFGGWIPTGLIYCAVNFFVDGSKNQTADSSPFTGGEPGGDCSELPKVSSLSEPGMMPCGVVKSSRMPTNGV